jgi:conjugal transfer pilus assembly protein TraW
MANFLKAALLALLLSSELDAKDLGIYGSTSSISEEDLIQFIKERIQSFSEEDRQQFMQSMQNYFVSELKKPMEVKGIRKAKKYSVIYFDPSICVDQDIFNHKGQIVVKKGTIVNPLSQVSLDQDLLFFDATDSEQLAWAESFSSSSKWILVKGQPMQLEKDLNRPIYFDQGGILIKKFGITQVPAHVSQEGIQLKIEFIPVGEKDA